jgi:hypothetical protein
MLIEKVEALLSSINGCTFASLDTETSPAAGIRKITTNERVILFTNKNSSGYEAKVKRHLEKAGKNPEDFVLGDLPWGTRRPGTPLIFHCGFWYLQTIILEEGESVYLMGNRLIPPERVSAFVRHERTSQGLPEGEEVKVRTYALENIKGLRVLGEDLVDPKAPRPRLSIKG